jgi:NAD(P)-dependent dehydrogenase (short-subunit alcohol dehydrogenase family)
MFQVNLFGHMNAARAILPLLRERGSGVIAFTSSSSAWMALPFMSHYAASKAALSAYIEGLDREVRSFGIRCIAFECGGFPTRLGQPRDANQEAFGSGGPAIAGYLPLFMELSGIWVANPMGHMPGDLRKCGERIVDVVKREGMASGLPWAVRVALGSDAMGYVEQKCDEQLQLLDAWKDVSRSTDRDGQENVANKEMFKFTTALEE